MKLKNPIAYLAIFLSAQVAHGNRAVHVTYSEIVNLKANCTPKDSCQYSDIDVEEDTLLSRNCQCGPQCTEYNTCCVDSPNRANTLWTLRHDMPVCVRVEDPYNSRKGYWMVSKCNPRWRGSRTTANLCNQAHVYKTLDPVASIPATDITTNKTYTNYYCGLCNAIESRYLKLWNIQLAKWQNPDLPIDEDFTDQVEYNDKIGSWGVWEQGHNGNFEFQNVSIITIPPKGATWCFPDFISDCDPTYSDLTVRRKCYAYMALVYMNYIQYRNVHCAICNFANVSMDQSSERIAYCLIGAPLGGMPLSFTHLIDVNPKDGNEVGKVSKCKTGESYDPFFKKCRTLVCGLPGYSIVNGRCDRV